MDQSNNTTRHLLKLMADEIGNKILLLLMDFESYSDEISRNIGVPRSTVAKKTKEMEEAGLLVSYETIADSGRKVKVFKFKDYQLEFNSVSEFLELIKKRE